MSTFTIHGARGSMPACHPSCMRYGGQTTCFSLETPDGLLVIDAGTGFSCLGDTLKERATIPPLTLLFTHFHVDHVMGLPFFSPLYDERTSLVFMAKNGNGRNWKKSLGQYMGKPFWPVELGKVPATVTYADLPGSEGHADIYGIKVSWCPLTHPQSCLAYRLEIPGLTIVVATDHEPGYEDADSRLAKFCRDANVLVCDAHYTPEEYEEHRGWGHGTWSDAADLAQRSGVGRLLLTHHDPRRSDVAVDAIVNHAREIFPNTDAARENMQLFS